jgi:hypothetical protein
MALHPRRYRIVALEPTTCATARSRILSVWRWLEDELAEAFVSWREACTHVHVAYALWDSAARQDRALAFTAYRAAVDREECAARIYGEVAARARAATR